MSESASSGPERPAMGPALWVALLGAALPGIYLLLTSTTNLVPGIWPYDAKRMLQFALLLLIFLLPATNRRLNSTLGSVLAAVPNWVGWTLIGIFAWGTVSAIVNARSAMHLANSLSEVALLGSLVLAALVLAACRRVGGLYFDQIAVGLLALTGLVVGLQELLGVAAARAGGVEFNFRLSLLHFSWPRFYNQVQTWSMPAIVALPVLFARFSLARFLCVVVLGLHWYIIFMTGARGSFVALAAAFTFAMLFLPAIRMLLLKWQLAGFLLGVVVFWAAAFSLETSETAPAEAAAGAVSDTTVNPTWRLNNSYFDTGDFVGQSVGRNLLDPMGRTWMWQVTLRDAAANPVLGIGPMNYVCTSPEHIGHPHSFPLQLAAEWGSPVALSVFALFTVLILRATATARRSDRQPESERVLSGLLLTSVLAAALHACVSGVVVMPASQTVGLLVCGLLLGMLLPDKPGVTHPGRNYLWMTGALLATGLLVLGVNELRTLPERSAQLSVGESLRPRIWQDAKVCRLYVPQNEVSN